MTFNRELLSIGSLLMRLLHTRTPFVRGASSVESKNALSRAVSMNCGTADARTFRQFSKSGQTHRTYHDGIPRTTIKAINALEDEKLVEITWNESPTRGLFPFVWLRDHCQCDRCFHPVSRSRTMLFQDLRLDEFPIGIKVEKDSVLEVQWSDGHISRYYSDWLQERKFERSVNDLKRPSAYRLPKIFWESEIWQNLPTANFQELMLDDFALLTWLQKLEVFGFVLIKNAPPEHGQVKRLADRVSFVRKTHYGGEFTVKAKPDPSNVAYSHGPLQLHTDLPYYEYKPGVQMIHCIIQFEGNGGQSQVADGAHVARELKKISPQKFEALSETPVDWCDIGIDEGREFFKILQRPVICLDSNGEIGRINFSHPQRDSFLNVSLEKVFKWYDGMKTFHNMLHDPQYCLEFKMTPGFIQSFDNLRIVHGRKSYEENMGQREMEGCYMDWDEVRSKRRVLEEKLNVSSEFWCQQGLVSGSHKKR